jgi:hypothetical protein
MLRRWNKIAVFTGLVRQAGRLPNKSVCVLCAIISCSCGFADLRPIGIAVTPAETDTVLPGAYSPVMIEFDTEMERDATEGILQISSGMGTIAGDKYWKGNQLYFVPAPGWTAGVRYTLTLSGIVHSVDGRELRLEHFLSFYGINKNPPPLLEWHSPADGESVEAGNIPMEFRFSRPMERLSVESSLSVEGMANKKFEWSADDTVLVVIPEKAIPAWTTCRWTLKNSAKSREGVPLAKTVSARFSADLDRLMPKVIRVFPAYNSSGRWLPSGEMIENGLGPGQGIAVEFNKPMGENVTRSLRFEPSLAGRTEILTAKSVVFIPSRDPEPETAYTLIIPADTKDSGGLKLGEEFRISFVPDIPFLQVLAFKADGVPETAGGDMGSVIAVPANAGNGELYFTIRFSLQFTDAEKQNTALRISLVPFFPGTLEAPALCSAAWISDDRLRMKWERLMPGTANEAHYYKLLIPGGKGGINNGFGMYLKEDRFFFLEAR